MAKEQLFDLNVYGRGMETHIVAQSKIIGDFVSENCTKSYGDVQYAYVPASVATYHPKMERGEARVALRTMRMEDPRVPGQHYGYDSWANRGYGIIDMLPAQYGSSSTIRPNPAILLAKDLDTGLHIVLGKYVGQATIDSYVKGIRDEVQWLYNKFLRPGRRRIRMYVEDYRYE